MKPDELMPSYPSSLPDDTHRVAVITAALDMKRRCLAPEAFPYSPAPAGPENLAHEHWACLWDTAWDAMWRIAAFPESEQKARRWLSIQAAVRAAVSAGHLPYASVALAQREASHSD